VSVRPDEFLVDSSIPDPWSGVPQRVLDEGLIYAIRRGPVAGRDDLEVASALARLVQEDLNASALVAENS
jgi:hypothetical protein